MRLDDEHWTLDDERALVEVFRAAAGRAEVGEAVRAAEKPAEPEIKARVEERRRLGGGASSAAVAASQARVGGAMSAHTRHPDTHEHGLADGCARCAEHAERPLEGLDSTNLRALIVRTQKWMRDDPDALPRSGAELRAMRRIAGLITDARALLRVGIDP